MCGEHSAAPVPRGTAQALFLLVRCWQCRGRAVGRGGPHLNFEEVGVKVSCAVKLEHVYHFSITITNGVKHQFSES